MVTEIIKGQSLNLDSKSNMKHPVNKDDYPVRITMPQKQIIQLSSFKPFLESATPDEKLKLLESTLLKPKKRLRKLQEKRDKLNDSLRNQNSKRAKHQSNTDAMGGLFTGKRADGFHGVREQNGPSDEIGFKCPVYKCTKRLLNDMQLEQHYSEDHSDLQQLGLSIVKDQDTGNMVTSIKDTLLTSMIALAVTNKEQFRLFQSDF